MRNSSSAIFITLLVIGCGRDQPVSPRVASVRQFYEAKIASHEEKFDAFAGDEDLRRLRDPAERSKVPKSVLEACDFYYQNVLEQDCGDVQAFRVPSRGEHTFAIRVTSDGGDGWLEVFDRRGELLGAADRLRDRSVAAQGGDPSARDRGVAAGIRIPRRTGTPT